MESIILVLYSFSSQQHLTYTLSSNIIGKKVYCTNLVSLILVVAINKVNIPKSEMLYLCIFFKAN